MSAGMWRRIEGFRRAISRLQISVSADAEIQIRSEDTVVDRMVIAAGESWRNTSIPLLWLNNPFSVWLRSDDPNCQCQIQAEYSDDLTPVTDVPIGVTVVNPIAHIANMAVGYGLIGLGIPLAVTGMMLDLDASAPFVYTRPTRSISIHAEREQVKQEQPQTPCPGITRLQAFKRELEEEKPEKKQKHKFLSKLKHRNRGENK